mmetsp:Transcript_14037/g.37770  ORF Transcript_14037/g.37770 Transcript_14037/m.37770 type:complete len:221 (-) Transcript_14037:179-841(-)
MTVGPVGLCGEKTDAKRSRISMLRHVLPMASFSLGSMMRRSRSSTPLRDTPRPMTGKSWRTSSMPGPFTCRRMMEDRALCTSSARLRLRSSARWSRSFRLDGPPMDPLRAPTPASADFCWPLDPASDATCTSMATRSGSKPLSSSTSFAASMRAATLRRRSSLPSRMRTKLVPPGSKVTSRARRTCSLFVSIQARGMPLESASGPHRSRISGIRRERWRP